MVERRSRTRDIVLASALAGSVAGIIDIGAAALINWVAIPRVLRAVASGMVGRAAFGPEAFWPLLGIVLQVAMSVLIAAFYASAAVRMRRLLDKPVAWGLAFGMGVFLVMNLVVVPLSAARFKTNVTAQWVLLNVAAMLVFGVIVAKLVSFAMKRATR